MKAKKRKKRSKTQAERLASLEWNIKDAKEALKNAVDMGDWTGVRKYTGQIEKLELQRVRSSMRGSKRGYRDSLLMRHGSSEAAYLARQRGKSGAP
jgi:hypothetical protein